MKHVLRKVLYGLLGRGNSILNKLVFSLQKNDNNVVVFNTAISTDNLGDYIIMHYCQDVLDEIMKDAKFVDVSTHIAPSEEQGKIVKHSKYKFVCGTNLLTSHIEEWWNWRLPDGYIGKQDYRNIILLGVGWGTYQDKCSVYSKLIYRLLLNPCVLHSVRDQYTENKFKEIGIKNVINTGCPTMWNLTPQFCSSIPREKAKDVVATITDYRQDKARDRIMFEILQRCYENIYVWIQGKRDEEYIRSLHLSDKVILIPRSLEAYESRLTRGNIDYVGTRLHAGIYALNHRIRSIIIAVDNRAIEIARDTNLPIVLRENIQRNLEEFIKSSFSTEVKINSENINRFKRQFGLENKQ